MNFKENKFTPSFCACIHGFDSAKLLVPLQSVAFMQQMQFNLTKESLKQKEELSPSGSASLGLFHYV